MPRVEVVGHRGAAGLEPENTLRAIRRGLQLGCHRIEIDVHLTSDGHVVVIHDETLDRTTNGSGRVSDHTLAQIRELDAGLGERVPTLSEVLELFEPGGPLLQIELKGAGTAAPVAETIKGRAGCVAWTCFDAQRLAEAHRLLPEVPSGFLSSAADPDPVDASMRIGASAVHPRHTILDRDLVDRAHAAGLQVRVWNIDDADRMRWAIDIGVDAIGTNRPDIALAVV